ncbi:hypothetical protein [Micromonospora sp. NPDC048947]|uniref:hypothetical protein n=1 Tax=Micromonospora sp. NPDC048947 TaxID=3154826 RepID=UPI0033C4E93A
MHLPVDRTAEAVRDALLAVLAGLPEAARLTLTWDQGAEMAHQQQVAPLLRDGVLFAHPGRPSQRGTNENTNGPLRQYPPTAGTRRSTPPPISAPPSNVSTTGLARR